MSEENPTGEDVPTPNDCPDADGMPMLGLGTWKLTDQETFQPFDELVDEGLTDRIGVANFETELLAEAVDYAGHDIFAYKFECHPMLQQTAIHEVCEEHGVEPVPYSPLARGEVFGHEAISDIAGAHTVSEAQVSLAWLRGRGTTAIPKASTTAHLRDNWLSLSLQLTDGELEDLDAMAENGRQVNPNFDPWNR